MKTRTFHKWFELNWQHCNGLNACSLGFWSWTWFTAKKTNFFYRWPARPFGEITISFWLTRWTFKWINPFKINNK